jgi:hypothetical protein
MRALRTHRHIRATLDGPPSPIPDLPGLQANAASENLLDLLYSGPLPELLGWLATQSVVDLQIEPAGLADVYHQFHPNG